MRSCVGLFVREQLQAALRLKSPHAMSTKELIEELPEEMRSAVYRALKVLEREGMVVRCPGEDRVAFWAYYSDHDTTQVSKEIDGLEDLWV